MGVAAVGCSANGAACWGPNGYYTSISEELCDAVLAASAQAGDARVATVPVIEHIVCIACMAAAATCTVTVVHNAVV